jgi:hypothetical protein
MLARIAHGYCDGLEAGVRFQARARNFPLLQSVQIGSETHPSFYPIDTGYSFPEGKAAGGVKLTTHFHLMSRLIMVELYLHSPYVFMA